MKLRFIHVLFVFLAMAPILNLAAQMQQAQSTRPTQSDIRARRKAWHETMKQTPRPKRTGCFKASYPDTVWQETTCTAPPPVHYPPKSGGRSYTVGGGGHQRLLRRSVKPAVLGDRNVSDR